MKAIGEGLGLTPGGFAVWFGFGLDTVQNRESNGRRPDEAARSYLTAVARMRHRIEEAMVR